MTALHGAAAELNDTLDEGLNTMLVTRQGCNSAARKLLRTSKGAWVSYRFSIKCSKLI